MSVPEAAVDKNNRFVFRQHNIRFAGQFFVVQPVTESFGEQKFSHKHLGLCILTPDPAHIVTAGCLVVHISHYPNPLIRKYEQYQISNFHYPEKRSCHNKINLPCQLNTIIKKTRCSNL